MRSMCMEGTGRARFSALVLMVGMSVLVLVACPGARGSPPRLATPCLDSCLDPGEVRTFPLFVTNRGSGEQSYSVDVTLTDPSWTAWSETEALEDVGPGETRRFHLTVKAPRDAAGGMTEVAITTTPVAGSAPGDVGYTRFPLWVEEDGASYYEIYGPPTAVFLGYFVLMAVVLHKMR